MAIPYRDSFGTTATIITEDADKGGQHLAVMVSSVSLYLSTGTWFPLRLVSQGSVDASSGSMIEQMVWLILYLLSAMILFTGLSPSRYLRLELNTVAVWLFMVLALISTSWAYDFTISLKRGFSLLGTTIISAMIAQRFSVQQVFILLRNVLSCCLALSFASVVMIPNRAISAIGVTGIYPQKNNLGRILVLATILWLITFLSDADQRRRAVFWILACMAGLLMADSSAALVATSVLVLVCILIPLLRIHVSLLIPSFVLAIGTVWYVGRWIGSNSGELVGLLGRDPTMTGRTVLWEVLLDIGSDRKWLGFGYGGFWLGDRGPSGKVWYAFSRIGGWEAPHAHNGILDLWLSLGYIGLGIFLILFFVTLQRYISFMRISDDTIDAWPLLFLFYLVAINIADSYLVIHNSLSWMVFGVLALIRLNSLSGRRDHLGG